MRSLAITLALASTALASPAAAVDHSWYAGVEGGAMRTEDPKLNYSFLTGGTRTTANGQIGINTKTGFDGDIIGGYDFGMVRAEAEIGYKRAGISSLDTTNVFRVGGSNNPTADGSVSALSSMANVMLDFGDDSGWSGFVGGGVGVARLKFDISGVGAGSGAPNLADRDSKLAWQAIAGVRKSISPTVDLGLKYRFFNTRRMNFADAAANQGQYRARFRSHSLLASLIFNFAPPPPPPPPPPPAAPPPPPPPPATQTCPDGSVIAASAACPAPAAVSAGPFIVFFDWDKSEITSEARSILDNAASAYQQTGKAAVMLAGHADRSGSDAYNIALSQRRADAVRTYLAGRGVPDTAISSQALGESRPLVHTADGVREPQNRRVEISFGPGSGQ